MFKICLGEDCVPASYKGQPGVFVLTANLTLCLIAITELSDISYFSQS